MDFRFVILGAGGIAQKFADAARATEGCAVAAVASKSLARAEAFARENGIPAAYGSYEEMLETQRPDCAYIATTCDSHPALSGMCVERGVPVLCEKAMFSDEGQASAFFRAAKGRGLFAMEALWSLFLPANVKARAWIREGRIGRIVCADFDIGFAAPRDMENRYFNPALGGGAANDLTVYPLHLLPWITDRRIEGMGAQATAAPTGVDETEALVLRLSGNVTATVRATLAARVEERMAIYGTQGCVVVPKPHLAREAVLYDGEGREAERFRDTVTENGFVYEVAEAARCVREGLVESPTVPHAATIQAARYIGKIRNMV